MLTSNKTHGSSLKFIDSYTAQTPTCKVLHDLSCPKKSSRDSTHRILKIHEATSLLIFKGILNEYRPLESLIKGCTAKPSRSRADGTRNKKPCKITSQIPANLDLSR